MTYRYHRILIISFLFLSCSILATADPSSSKYAEGVLSNGMRVVVASDGMHSSTTIGLILPIRLVEGYEQSWFDVSRQWSQTSPFRVLYAIPTLESPILELRAALEDDPMALPDLVSAIKQTKWLRNFPDANTDLLPAPQWFYGNQKATTIVPQPSDIIFAVNGSQPIDALWELVKSACSDWTGKNSLYRTPPPDTLPRLWHRHRASESVDIVMFQRTPASSGNSANALRMFIADERLEQTLNRFLTKNEVGVSDCRVGLYPPLAPQWLWCAVRGPAEETQMLLRQINMAWNDLLASPFIPISTDTRVGPRSRDRKLYDYCLSKLYLTPTLSSDTAEFRTLLHEAIVPERWTFLITTDTTRCTMPETFQYHEW